MTKTSISNIIISNSSVLSWEQRKLGNLVTFSKGKGYTKKDLTEKGVPIFLYGTLYTNFHEKYDDIHTYVKMRSGSIISNGSEVVLPDSGETALDIARASWISKKGVILAGGLLILYPKDNISSEFLAYSLTYGRNHKTIATKAQGKSIVHIHKNDLENIFYRYPRNVNNQKRIIKILDKLNKCILLQQRKSKQLKLLKKAMLQTLFANKIAPQLRFQGFIDSWKQRKLGEVANILRGASPRPIKDPKWFDSNSKIGWIRISDVTKQHGRIHNLEQHLSKAGQDKTRVVYPPSLLLSIAASVGYPVITYIETGVHDGFVIFDKPKFNVDFMFFKLQQIQKTWNKYGQPGSQVNINSSIVSNTKILIPNNNEQLQISNILKKIEKCIHLQQGKTKKLKNLKQFLLQNMFI
ncbi:restriction endonuclease subunit S [Lactobacillus gasseri]|uniref:restriction endonuclease subunit S n=1 Tax=Lactobacillus gasseri TaxID=1596 RepID=UPI003BA1C607